MFTAAEVFMDAATGAPELLAHPVDPDVIARTFNNALRDLVLEVTDADEERLAAEYVVPAAVVRADTVDLTDDGSGSGAREWLNIVYIDWRDAEGDGFEVWISTLEARHRAGHDYQGQVSAHLIDQLRRLRKLDGWEGVHELVVYGVLVPKRVTASTLDKEQYDYPAVLEAALKWELLVALASHLGLQDSRVVYWEGKRQEARERLFGDAKGHIAGRIEAVSPSYEW